MIRFQHKGDFKNTFRFFNNVQKFNVDAILNRYGRIGVESLASATPTDTGNTAGSWSYSIQNERNRKAIHWSNSNINKGVPIAVILQYGHGTRNGGYVQGRDYINPAMRPVFDSLAEAVWKEVFRL